MILRCYLIISFWINWVINWRILLCYFLFQELLSITQSFKPLATSNVIGNIQGKIWKIISNINYFTMVYVTIKNSSFKRITILFSPIMVFYTPEFFSVEAIVLLPTSKALSVTYKQMKSFLVLFMSMFTDFQPVKDSMFLTTQLQFKLVDNETENVFQLKDTLPSYRKLNRDVDYVNFLQR